MSAYENTPGIERKIHHIHNPIIPKKGLRKPRKKRVYANLMLTQQMIEAKEAEKKGKQHDNKRELRKNKSEGECQKQGR